MRDSDASQNPDDYEAAPARTVTWTLSDGSASNNPVSTETINITAINNPPTLSGVAASASFAAGGAAATLSPAVTVADPDDLRLASATVAITGGTFAGDGDVLACNTAGTSITATYMSGKGAELLILTGTDPKIPSALADYQAVLDTVTFSTTSADPTNSGADPTRTITWVLDDGGRSNNLSTAVTETVNVVTGPLIAGTAAAAFTEEGPAATLSPGFTVVDTDSAQLSSATVAISGGTFAGDGDLLAASVAGTSITARYNTTSETLTLSGSDTLAHYSQVLQASPSRPRRTRPSSAPTRPAR